MPPDARSGRIVRDERLGEVRRTQSCETRAALASLLEPRGQRISLGNLRRAVVVAQAEVADEPARRLAAHHHGPQVELADPREQLLLLARVDEVAADRQPQRLRLGVRLEEPAHAAVLLPDERAGNEPAAQGRSRATAAARA